MAINGVNAKLKFKTGVQNDNAFIDLEKLKAEYVRQIHAQFIKLSIIHAEKLRLPLALYVSANLEDQIVVQDMLSGGKSLGHFGIEIDQARTFLAAFTEYMKKNIFITPVVIPDKNQIIVSTEIRFAIDYAEIAKLDEAEYISAKSGWNIPWVKWLLTMGTQKIIHNHRITFNPDILAVTPSRSGQAVMVRGFKGWSVPEEFAGTSNDNMIVNALKKMTGSDGAAMAALMGKYYKDIFDSMF